MKPTLAFTGKNVKAATALLENGKRNGEAFTPYAVELGWMFLNHPLCAFWDVASIANWRQCTEDEAAAAIAELEAEGFLKFIEREDLEPIKKVEIRQNNCQRQERKTVARDTTPRIKTHFNHLEKKAAEEFLSRGKNDKTKFTPSARELGRLLVNTGNAIYWSVARLAKTLRCCDRTIVRAFAELKAEGFLTLHRRRRGTTIKIVCIDAIRDGAARKITTIIQECAEALKTLPQRLVRTPFSSKSHSIVRDFAYRTQNGASEGLKRAAAALTRTPKLFGA